MDPSSSVFSVKFKAESYLSKAFSLSTAPGMKCGLFSCFPLCVCSDACMLFQFCEIPPKRGSDEEDLILCHDTVSSVWQLKFGHTRVNAAFSFSFLHEF